MENEPQITDTDRINWLEKGHAIVGLANRATGKTKFCADFHKQDWTEHATVREAIDAAMKEEQS